MGELSALYIILAVIFDVGLACAWGFATRAVIHNKGYQENWFWWGFFFGFIAFIVALTKPYVNRYVDNSPHFGRRNEPEQVNSIFRKTDDSESNPSLNSTLHWLCPFCGNNNPAYLTTCLCGEKRPKFQSEALTAANRSSMNMKDGDWYCPRCKAINKSYITTCTCGNKKR